LPTVFKEDGSVTPGNASQISDGASALLITSEAFAEEHDLEIMAEVGMNNVAGVDPTVMGIGPVPATKGLLERNGRDIDEYDLVELNEAFASQSLYPATNSASTPTASTSTAVRSRSVTRWRIGCPPAGHAD